MSWYFVRSSGSLESIAISNLANLFSSVRIGFSELECTQRVDATIQQCTVVLDTPIDFASFRWVHSTHLIPSSMNYGNYLGILLEFFPGQQFRRINYACGVHVLCMLS